MKPSLNRYQLQQQGKTILRAQPRRYGSILVWVIVHYTGGWSNWSEKCHFATQDDAYNEIESVCKLNENIINDRDLD